MVCKRCSYMFNDGDKFCPNCGTPVVDAQPHQPGYGAQPHQPGYGAQPHQPGYGAQPHQPGYGAQPHQPGYGSQPHQPGHGAQPHQPGYGAQSHQPGYGSQSPYYGGNPYPPHGNLMDNPLGMKWFKFLIYFGLFFGAVANLVYGISHINGAIWKISTGNLVDAQDMYRVYGSGLKALDIFAGVGMLGCAVLQIVTRFSLAGFKKSGPTLVTACYAVGMVISAVYSIGVMAIASDSGIEIGTSSMFAELAINLAVLGANITYFKKRSHLFIY